MPTAAANNNCAGRSTAMMNINQPFLSFLAKTKFRNSVFRYPVLDINAKKPFSFCGYYACDNAASQHVDSMRLLAANCFNKSRKNNKLV